MVRTQILLTEDLHRDLKLWANDLGISLSEAVRRCVSERLLEERGVGDVDARRRNAASVIGKYAESGPSDTARLHDEALAEAYAE